MSLTLSTLLGNNAPKVIDQLTLMAPKISRTFARKKLNTYFDYDLGQIKPSEYIADFPEVVEGLRFVKELLESDEIQDELFINGMTLTSLNDIGLKLAKLIQIVLEDNITSFVEEIQSIVQSIVKLEHDIRDEVENGDIRPTKRRRIQ